MRKRHTSVELVRNYLLGTISADDADRLEEEYFTDLTFFKKMQDLERKLIEDYLDGRLEGEDRERFRSRYLVVPEMRKRFEEIRDRRQAVGLPLGLRWQYVVAGLTLIACALAPWLFLRGHGQGTTETVRNYPPSPPAAVMDVELTPGIDKSGSAKEREFAIPKGGRVRLSMEIPGRGSPVDCVVTVAAAGETNAIWKSPRMQTEALGSGQRVRVELDAATLVPNDYLARVEDTGGTVLETYSFRVKAAN